IQKAKKESKISNPIEMLFKKSNDCKEEEENDENEDDIKLKRNQVKQKLEKGEMENETVTIELEEQPASMFDMLQGSGMEQMGMNLQDSLNQMMPKKTKKRKTTVKEA